MKEHECDLKAKEVLEKGLLQFRAFDEHVRKSLINSEIIFGAAKNFNDPFDCNLPIDLKEAELTEYLNNANRDKLESELRFRIYDFRRFSCFHINSSDEVHSNSLFWANYADKHRGICLKFKGDMFDANNHFLVSPTEGINSFPIEYLNEIPEFSYINYSDEKKRKSYKDAIKLYGRGPSQYFFGIKSKVWETENEVRFVYKSPNNFPIMEQYINLKYNPNMLERVYIGCNASQSTVDEVFKIMHLPKYLHVDVIKLVRDNKEFKFVEEKLK